MGEHNFVPFTVSASIFGTLGVALNFLVCLVYIINKNLFDATNIIIFNISCGQFLYSIVALPMLVTSNVQGRWSFGDAGCAAYGFLTTFFGLGTMMLLAGAAYERYFRFTNLFSDGERVLSNRKTMRLCLMLWCYSFFWSAVPLVGWSSYVQEGIGTSCSLKWKSDQAIDVSYELALIAACFLLPIAVIIVCHYKSHKAILHWGEIAKQRWGANSQAVKATVQLESKLSRLTLIMTIAFLVAWLPYTIVSLVAMFGPNLVSDIGASVPAYIAKSSACYNPIIYAIVRRELRQKMTTLLCGKKARVDQDGNHGTPTLYASGQLGAQTNIAIGQDTMQMDSTNIPARERVQLNTLTHFKKTQVISGENAEQLDTQTIQSTSGGKGHHETVQKVVINEQTTSSLYYF